MIGYLMIYVMWFDIILWYGVMWYILCYAVLCRDVLWCYVTWRDMTWYVIWIIQWNVKQISYFSLKKMHLTMLSAKHQASTHEHTKGATSLSSCFLNWNYIYSFIGFVANLKWIWPELYHEYFWIIYEINIFPYEGIGLNIYDSQRWNLF